MNLIVSNTCTATWKDPLRILLRMYRISAYALWFLLYLGLLSACGTGTQGKNNLIQDSTIQENLTSVSSSINASVRVNPNDPSSPFSIDELHAKERIALIIGNGLTYQSDKLKLENPPNDAKAMALELSKLGFSVTPLYEATKSEMENAINAFGQRLQGDTVGLFYYAGHGSQFNNLNYLMPIGSMDIKRADEIPIKGVSVNKLIEVMRTAGNKLNIVILDACRDNPFEQVSAGLAPVSEQGSNQLNTYSTTRGNSSNLSSPKEPDLYVIYAADAGKVAFEGEDSIHSPLTENLLRYIGEGDLKIQDMFQKVAKGVSRDTDGYQRPYTYEHLTKNFYFVVKPSRLIPSINAEVKRLSFYEDDFSTGANDECKSVNLNHRDSFPKDSIRYIYWEIYAEFPKLNNAAKLELKTVIYRNGVFLQRRLSDIILEAGWTYACPAVGWGSNQGDIWSPGNYTVDIFIDSEFVAKGSFTVF